MSAHQLWLKLPRSVLLKRGFGIMHRPGQVRDQLSGTFFIDPLTQCLCAPPVLSFADPLSTDAGTGWVERAPWRAPDGTYPGGWWEHTADGAFALTTEDQSPQDGYGFYLGFLCWPQQPAFTVEFGVGLVAELAAGKVTLRRDGNDLRAGQLWDAEEWTRGVHYLYLYCVGRQLCARRVGDSDGRGVSVLDPGCDAEQRRHSIRASAITVRGSGRLCVGLAWERHQQTIDVAHPLIKLAEPAATALRGVAWQVQPSIISDEEPSEGEDAPDVAVVDALDKDGLAADVDATEVQYRIRATLSADEGGNLYVVRTQVLADPLTASDGLTGVDLNAIAGVSLESVKEQLSLEPGSSKLTFTLKGPRGSLSTWVQANMTLEWCPNGTLRFRGLTTRPRCVPDLSTETITIEADDLWKRFRHTRWSGGEPYDNLTLPEMYADVAARAGFTEDEIEVYEGADRFPNWRPEGEPRFEFRAEQTHEDILKYLREQIACDDILRFEPDGKFHARRPPETVSDTTFYWVTSADELINLVKGTPTIPRILSGSWDEEIDETGFANEVRVAGLKDGAPLVVTMTDWASVNDPTAWNYVGEVRRATVLDASLKEMADVEKVCRQMWEQSRRLKVRANGRALLVLERLPGDIVTLDGRGTWRILSMETTWDKDGPVGLTQYGMEAVA